MPKSLILIMFSLLAMGARADARLTEMELRWLDAGKTVLAYGKQVGLPIDIIVQPQAGPNDVPLAMGFEGARCKLVLSLRGNPTAEEILQSVAPAQRPLMIEAMMAHEIGHCWRYAHGDWHVLPSGFVEAESDRAVQPELRQQARAMRETRREEGYSDLVALAWTYLRHPEAYAQVLAWIENLRSAQPNLRGSHDTVPWLRQATHPAAFAGTGTVFEQGRLLWNKGLAEDE